MALTENERTLLDGIKWMRTVQHESYHQQPGERVPVEQCTRAVCQHANRVVEWAAQQEAQP